MVGTMCTTDYIEISGVSQTCMDGSSSKNSRLCGNSFSAVSKSIASSYVCGNTF
jgi:hypothetical protein